MILEWNLCAYFWSAVISINCFEMCCVVFTHFQGVQTCEVFPAQQQLADSRYIQFLWLSWLLSSVDAQQFTYYGHSVDLIAAISLVDTLLIHFCNDTIKAYWVWKHVTHRMLHWQGVLSDLGPLNAIWPSNQWYYTSL